jgi:hypothetical protein
VETGSTESAEEPIELQLGLRIAGLTLVPGDRPEASWAAAAIGTVLREYPSDATDGGVNCKIDSTIRTVVDRDQDGGMYNCALQRLHCGVLLLGPGKRLALASEKDKRARDGGVVADLEAHVAGDA